MPQVIIRYRPSIFSVGALSDIRRIIQPILADLLSTDLDEVIENEIEWHLRPYTSGTIAPEVSVEVRTFGFPERKIKITTEAVHKLKEAFLTAGLQRVIKKEELFLRVEFIDPDSVEV